MRDGWNHCALLPGGHSRRTGGLQWGPQSVRTQFGEMALRFTNVFVRRDGRWQLVLHHSTPVQAK